MKYLSRVIFWGLLLAGCGGKNPEPEQALNGVTLLSRSQEAFYVEQGRFTDRLEDLKIDWLPLKETTPNYRYQFRLWNAQNTTGVITLASSSKSDHLLAIVSKAPGSPINKILCRGKTKPPEVINPDYCPPGFELLNSPAP